MMNGIKIELLGIGVILLSIACSMDNIIGFAGGIFGLIVTGIGLLVKK